ncbi:alpha/beta fold hydrolase [Arenimonas fontis]|uniref:Alpha/beta fold hydrolase n=1 Tax=Arenimonas fontis TaxID=2608255 RepID=A0A5B2ZBE2_9GAMM|nr:alpha/beta fold hydrolase [Arenimonas fontis]KAA2284590.1 alpha/beta fold hydrolase [Arenimonas fontis]
MAGPGRRRLRTALTAAAVALLAALALAWYSPEAVLRAEFARQRWLAGATVVQMQAAGHRWAVLEAGQGGAGPTVLLIHGFVGSKENWLPLIRALPEHWHVLAPDLPGWNESQRLAGADYGPVAQAERLAAFIRRLPRPPDLVVGHSMGGQLGGLLAARHPELVPRLVLMSSAGVAFEENAFATAVLAGDNPFAVTDRAGLRRFLALTFADPPFVPWPLDEALVRRRRANGDFEQQVLDGIGRGPEALLLQSLLPRIRVPVLLLWCDRDRVIDASAAAVFAAGLPEARTLVLPGCGHMPLMERPPQVAEAIVGFVASPP